MLSQRISLISMKFSCNKGCFIVTVLMGLSMQTLKKQECTELLGQKCVYKVKFSVKNTCRTSLCHRIHGSPMIINVCTLLSLLQLIKCFKLHVVRTRNLTLFSWRNIDYTTRISENVQIKHVFSMNFTHFHHIFLQKGLFHCNRPNGSKYANTEKARGYRAFGATKCL